MGAVALTWVTGWIWELMLTAPKACSWLLEDSFYCVSSLFQELGLVGLLEKEEIQAGVAAANMKGDEEQASKSSPDRGLACMYHRLLEENLTLCQFQ